MSNWSFLLDCLNVSKRVGGNCRCNRVTNETNVNLIGIEYRVTLYQEFALGDWGRFPSPSISFLTLLLPWREAVPSNTAGRFGVMCGQVCSAIMHASQTIHMSHVYGLTSVCNGQVGI